MMTKLFLRPLFRAGKGDGGGRMKKKTAPVIFLSLLPRKKGGEKRGERSISHPYRPFKQSIGEEEGKGGEHEKQAADRSPLTRINHFPFTIRKGRKEGKERK